MRTPTAITEYACSGSLFRIQEFITADGLRYCLTIFSLSDYNHLHFSHDEYKLFIRKLIARLSMQARLSAESNACDHKLNDIDLSITCGADIKIQLDEKYNLIIGSVTAFGLANTIPFADIGFNKKQLTCNFKWDICTCKTCPVFSRLIEYESKCKRLFGYCKPKNIVFTSDTE